MYTYNALLMSVLFFGNVKITIKTACQYLGQYENKMKENNWNLL